MNLTISDIAKLANVSKSAVSIVLNNKPGVSDKTREKVQGIVKKYNYNPSQIAQSLVVRKTKSIGLIITEIDNPFFTKVMKGVYDTCSELGYSVLIGSSELSPDKENGIIENFKSKRLDGFIISPLSGEGVDYLYLSTLLKENIPFVMLRNVANYQINLVDIDNVNAAYKAVSYLIKLGHREIAYLSGPVHSGHGMERLEGFKQAHLENNIQIKKEFIIQAGSYLPDGYKAGKQFVSSTNQLPSAIFCYNDLVAIGLINALNELGIDVPGTVSVIGFDNIDFSKYVKTPLTTIDMPAYNIGRTATHLLIKQISQNEKLLNRRIILDAKLIERGSCRKKM
ncbi:MAG: LacI family DNA-binding transcriptional regulator [Ignavibacteria bacterium]|jgi:DNA-binding LacI/PurR family transcriptional regulator